MVSVRPVLITLRIFAYLATFGMALLPEVLVGDAKMNLSVVRLSGHLIGLARVRGLGFIFFWEVMHRRQCLELLIPQFQG